MTSFYHERHKSERLEAMLEEGGYTTWAMDACHDILDARRECQRLRKIIELQREALKLCIDNHHFQCEDYDDVLSKASKALLPED